MLRALSVNERALHALVLLRALLALIVVAACSNPVVTAPGASATAGSPAVIQPPSTDKTLTDESHGLSIILPTDWFGITQSDVANPAKIDALSKGLTKGRANNLVASLQEHPEYWFTAMHQPDDSIVRGHLENTDNFAGWVAEQEAALKAKYPDLTMDQVSVPRDGVVLQWTGGIFAESLYAFERPAGAAVFRFTTRPAFKEGLDSLLETFTDAGS